MIWNILLSFFLLPSAHAASCPSSAVCQKVKEVHQRLGGRGKITITSGYRSPKRNRRAGGATRSCHLRGQAVDFQISGVGQQDLLSAARGVVSSADELGISRAQCGRNAIHIAHNCGAKEYNQCTNTYSRTRSEYREPASEQACFLFFCRPPAAEYENQYPKARRGKRAAPLPEPFAAPIYDRSGGNN